MLFKSNKIVIYLSLTHIVVGDCRTKKPIFFQLDYLEDLTESFKTIVTKYPSTNFKIILGSDVSYTVKWPKSSTVLDRETIHKELTKYIPEDFVDNQFDWKLDKDGDIEAIVITTPIFKSFQQLKSKYPNISFDTQSSTSLLWEMGETNLSKETGGEIFMFMASKSSGGKDEKVLEIDISSKNVTPSSSHKSYLWIFVFVVGFSIILAIIYSMILFKPKIQEIPIASPTATPFIVSEKNISDYKVSVQNGTAIDGLAGSTKDLLLSQGFTQVTPADSSSPSATTIVYLKDALPDNIQQKIISALGSRIPAITIGIFDNNMSDNDIVILLGEK